MPCAPAGIAFGVTKVAMDNRFRALGLLQDEFSKRYESGAGEAHRANAERAGTGYTGYGDDYRMELKPTGHAAAPYVGILRYQQLRCADAARTCKVAGRSPVTEIFRFQNGRWVY